MTTPSEERLLRAAARVQRLYEELEQAEEEHAAAVAALDAEDAATTPAATPQPREAPPAMSDSGQGQEGKN